MADREETLKDLLGSEGMPQEEADSIDRIAVVGAGQMGLGIAQAVASKGLEVMLVERDDNSLEERKERLSQKLDAEIARWSMTESDKRAILSRLTWTSDLSQTGDYLIVIEAVPDTMEIKKALFERLDAITSPGTILVTNTSTLSVTELGEVTTRPDRVIGMHFLHPVPKKPLVEVVRGMKTSDSTFNIAKSFAEDVRKTVVEVYETPGFVTTRVILPMVNEAMYALMEGVATAEGIDIAMRDGYDFHQGPLELADNMGLDEVWQWLERMFRETGDFKFRPCPLLRKMVRGGQLGVKTGEGFFKYDENGRRMKADE